MFQLCLLFFADFIIDERHLHVTVDSEQDGKDDGEDGECPPREDITACEIADEIEDCVHLTVGEHKERYYQ